MSKSKKLITSSFFGVLDFFVTIGITLYITPFLISHLGDRLYGLWVLFGSFFGFYGMLDLGLETAVRRYLSRAIGLNDYDEVNKVFSSALIVFIGIGVIALFLTVLIAFLGPLIFQEITEVSLFRKIAILTGISLSIGFPMRAIWAIFSCHLRFELNNYVSLGKTLVRTVLIILFLSNGYKLLTFALIMIFTDIAGYICSAILAFNLDPNIRFNLKLIQKSHLKKLLHYSSFSFISKTVAQLTGNLDYFVITKFIGIEPLTLYSISLRFFSYYGRLMASTMGIATPLFSAYEGQNNFKAIREKLFLLLKISGYISCLAGGILILFCKPFIICWVGEKYVWGYNLVLILFLPFLLRFIQSPRDQILYGISKHKLLAYTNVIGAIANITISILLVKDYGLAGVAIGTAAPALIKELFILPGYLCKQINLSLNKYYFQLLKILTISLTIFSTLYLLFERFFKVSFSSIGLWTLICSLTYCFLAFYLIFSKEERKYLITALKNVLKINNK